jgi:hypothetical protein
VIGAPPGKTGFTELSYARANTYIVRRDRRRSWHSCAWQMCTCVGDGSCSQAWHRCWWWDEVLDAVWHPPGYNAELAMQRVQTASETGRVMVLVDLTGLRVRTPAVCTARVIQSGGQVES